VKIQIKICSDQSLHLMKFLKQTIARLTSNS